MWKIEIFSQVWPGLLDYPKELHIELMAHMKDELRTNTYIPNLATYNTRLILFSSVEKVFHVKNWNIQPSLTWPARLPKRATYRAHGSYERWTHEDHIHTKFSHIKHQANTFFVRWRSLPCEKLKYSAKFDRACSTTRRSYISSSWLIWKMSSGQTHTYQI